MSFGMKNATETYQILANKMFVDLIGKTMEAYMNDMLVKSLKTMDHVKNHEAIFQILARYRMRLNLLKFAFGIISGKFLGYMVKQKVIEAILEMNKTLMDMSFPNKPKKM